MAHSLLYCIAGMWSCKFAMIKGVLVFKGRKGITLFFLTLSTEFLRKEKKMFPNHVRSILLTAVYFVMQGKSISLIKAINDDNLKVSERGLHTHTPWQTKIHIFTRTPRL